MKKITSLCMLFLGLIMILLIVILCLTGVSWIFVSIPYGILISIQNSDFSIKLFVISIILFFFFLTEKKGKVILFNISMIFFLMGAVGKYLILSREYSSPVVITDSRGWNLLSDTLGFRHPKNFFNHSVCKSGDTLFYDVHYTTDENGFRKTPRIKFNKSTKGIVFFGCSFTFGQGLDDSLVMPNIVQNLVKNSYKVYNFSNAGYGTHQMLASIENNMIDSLVKYEPKIFIYAAIGDHINRVLNFVDYGYHSPRYVLDPETKEVRYMGRFDDGNNTHNFNTHNFKLQSLFQKRQAGLADVKLFVAMVKKSQKLLLEKYPQSEFHVIFYNYELLVPAMMRELRNADITVHSIITMVPDYYSSLSKYCIHFPSEQHANGLRNKIIGDYIVKNILVKVNR